MLNQLCSNSFFDASLRQVPNLRKQIFFLSLPLSRMEGDRQELGGTNLIEPELQMLLPSSLPLRQKEKRKAFRLYYHLFFPIWGNRSVHLFPPEFFRAIEPFFYYHFDSSFTNNCNNTYILKS